MLHVVHREPSRLLMSSWPVSVYAAEAGQLRLICALPDLASSPVPQRPHDGTLAGKKRAWGGEGRKELAPADHGRRGAGEVSPICVTLISCGASTSPCDGGDRERGERER